MQFPASPHCADHDAFNTGCGPCETAYANDPRVTAYRDAVRADCNTPNADVFFAQRGEANPIASVITTVTSR